MSLPAGDRAEGIAWTALGAAVVVLSMQMDRLADQGVPPYAAPGLLPGLLGAFMVFSGGLLVLRHTARVEDKAPSGTAQLRRLGIVLALCLAFSLGLIGHGLPFWLAASLFVIAAILVLQGSERSTAGRRFGVHAVAVAVAIGLGAGCLVTLVFQDIFLVHLP